MIAILSLIGGLRGLVVGVAGAGAMFGLLTAYHAAFVHPGLVRAAVAEGARVERVQWEEAQRIIRIEAERRLAVAQAEIDRIEREAIEAGTRAALAEAALEDVIHELDTSPNPPVIALPRRLRDHLAPIGK